MIGAVLLGYASHLPHATLQAFGQRLEAFTETDRDGLYTGVRQHEREQQVREGHAAQRDAQVVHMGEIGLTSFTWLMPLFEDDILLRPMQRFPLRDVSLQGAHLDRLVPLGMLLTQQRKQRCSL